MNAFARLATERRSVRAYLPRDVPLATLQQIMELARQAPSSSNLQHGSFIAVQGQRRQLLCDALTQAWRDKLPTQEEYSYYPDPMPMRLRKRQVAAAQALYGALGIARNDQHGREAQFERNFRFFDAPVALVACGERNCGNGAWLDLGMGLYGLMLAAQSLGLATCAIGAIAAYPALVRAHLELPAGQTVVCGLALGWADPQAPVNAASTARCGLDEYFRTID